jgi:hypothetical protein
VSLLTTLQGLSPAALYVHADAASGTMADSSGNGRTGTYQTNARLHALGLGNSRTTTAVRFAGDGNGRVARPPAGAVWATSSWTFAAAVRFWGFEDEGSPIWLADNNGVFDTPAIRMENGAGNSYNVSVCLRWGGLPNLATIDISDTHLWHMIICRVNNLTAGSIRIDGTDVSPAVWTNQAYTFSATPTPQIGDTSVRAAMQYSAWWPSSISDVNCQAIEAAFDAENVVTEERTSVYMGSHQNLDDQFFQGIRRNQTRVLARDGGNVTRGDFLVDQWNPGPAATDFDWTRADDIFLDCADKGIRVWVLAHGSAGYMNSSAGRFAVPGTALDATFTTWLGLQQTAWETFATRYAGGSVHNPGDSPIYEWWNEPNAEAEWKTQNGVAYGDATQWARYCKTMKNAVAAIDAAAVHVTGGVNSWYAPGGNDIQGETFLRTAYATTDLAGFTNIGMHPYPGSGASPDVNANYDNSYDDFVVFADVVNELWGPTASPWLTEVGWSAALVSEADQNSKLSTAVTRWRDYWSYSPAFIWWPDWDASFGVGQGLYSDMDEDGSDPTARLSAPTYAALMQGITGLPEGEVPEEVRLLLTPAGATTLVLTLTPTGQVIVITDDGFYVSAVTYPSSTQYPGGAYSNTIEAPHLSLTPA